eukprot:GCRY01002090.1.p1 GENE.GCRY01002090.1~~GCRY01002090.1.p1  ORF type:complete len:390 (+),score=85.32 GCRY01002090.1:142-1311(+)
MEGQEGSATNSSISAKDKLKRRKALEEKKRKERIQNQGVVSSTNSPVIKRVVRAQPNSAAASPAVATFTPRGDEQDPAATVAVRPFQESCDDDDVPSIPFGNGLQEPSSPVAPIPASELVYEPVSFNKAPQPVKPDLSDLESFCTNPVPKSCGIVQCYIKRYKTTFSQKRYPQYDLVFEDGEQFLLAARRRKKSKSSNYLISLDKTDMARHSAAFLGKLRANFVGTEFIVYDKGENPKKCKNGLGVRRELAAVLYESNILGVKGPRKMQVIVPAISPQGTPYECAPKTDESGILARFKKKDLSQFQFLHNKQPVWNEQTESYVLNFSGRVTKASVKNFQLIDKEDANYIMMQFGRVSDDTFTLDFQWPLSPLQAFAIALSSFDGKLFCE